MLVPGCKARTVNCDNPENNGKIVTVIGYIGHVPGWEGNDRWKVDIWMNSAWSSARGNHAQEDQLERIDYDGDNKVSWDSMQNIWSPKVEV